MPRRSQRLLALVALVALVLQTFTPSAAAGATPIAQLGENALASAAAAPTGAEGFAGPATQSLTRATPFLGDLRRLAPARTIRRDLAEHAAPEFDPDMYAS